MLNQVKYRKLYQKYISQIQGVKHMLLLMGKILIKEIYEINNSNSFNPAEILIFNACNKADGG